MLYLFIRFFMKKCEHILTMLENSNQFMMTTFVFTEASNSFALNTFVMDLKSFLNQITSVFNTFIVNSFSIYYLDLYYDVLLQTNLGYLSTVNNQF